MAQTDGNRRVPITWRNRGRLHLPYLLIEADDRGVSASELMAFWKAGFNPAFCKVPASGGTCPLLNGERCALVESADIVLHRPHRRLGIVDAIHECSPNVPVVAPVANNDCEDLSGQIDALEEALSRSGTWRRSFGRLGISS